MTCLYDAILEQDVGSSGPSSSSPTARSSDSTEPPGVPGPYQDLAATKVGALEAEQRAIREALAPKLVPEAKQEVPTFAEWFKGRFWREWVVGRREC
jgi:hypothetical protein